MNKSLPTFLLATLLLGGCDKPAKMPATSLPATSTPAVGKPAGEAGDKVVPATDSIPVATNEADVAPAVDDDTAVNASIDKLLGEHVRYQAVITAYQQAVTRGDKAAVAALVEYPIRVDISGSKATIKDPAAFMRDYDKIVTPAIARAITEQKYSELLVNSQGVMFGSGETWINGVCKQDGADCSEFEVKVVTIQAGAVGP